MVEQPILLVEKTSNTEPMFAEALRRKGFNIVLAETGAEALEIAANDVDPLMVILNAPSLGSSGVRICRRLDEQIGVPIIHILPGDNEGPTTCDDCCAIALHLPFTSRKLINRMKRFFPVDPENTVEVGDIRLVIKTRVVKAHGRESRLTPKASSLLEVFLRHPGKILDRGYLMRQVWKTNYVGDTRTLDVHVRWVREAIEPEPASPRHIRTVRGVGYRFVPTLDED